MLHRFAPFIVLLLSSSLLAADPILKAGFVEKDITPEIGMEAPGGYGKSYHRTVHDPCKVRVSVFDDGTNKAAVIGIDALGIRRETVLKVRQAIEKETGIPGEAVLIGASHSHSSGPIVWIMPGEFDHASDLVKDLAYNQSTCVDPKYLATVEKALIDGVREAHEKRGQVKAGHWPWEGGHGRLQPAVQNAGRPSRHTSRTRQSGDRRTGRTG